MKTNLLRSLAIALSLVVGGASSALADVKIMDYQTGVGDCISADTVTMIGRTLAAKTNVPIALIVLPRDTLVDAYSEGTPEWEMYQGLIRAMKVVFASHRVPLIITCGSPRSGWGFFRDTGPNQIREFQWSPRPIPGTDSQLWVPKIEDAVIPF